ncbi:MAG: DMT family transporter [Candidatus Curtissbacteria bacterium]|nr:DMT family transporter [Candidatus Curtissbacteria bacterium]
MKLKSPYVLILIAVFIWGGAPAIMKLTLTQIPVFSLAFLRMFLASLLMLPFALKSLHFKKQDLSMFILAALFGVTLNLAFFFIGLKLTYAINAALLIAATPILTLFASSIFLKEKLTAKLILASLTALAGVVVIIGKPQAGSSSGHLLGNILLMLASITGVVHSIVAKKLLKIYDGTTVTFYTLLIGALTFVPFVVWEFVTIPNWIASVNSIGLAGLVYGIVLASLAAYWAWMEGLKRLPAGEASFFFYIDPITGAILAIILLGEKLTRELIVGGLLITIAVILAEHKRRNHPLHKRLE